jgi:hypothetical protein
MNNNYMMYDVCSVQVVSGACLNFFFMIFKDGLLENFDRFLKIDWLKNEKFKEDVQTAWSKDTSYSCRSFMTSMTSTKKNSKKIVVVGFFYFLNFALKNTFPTRPHTCHSKMVDQSLKIYQNFRGAIFKNHKKKFKQTPLTTWTEHTSYSCCSLVIFLDCLKMYILSNSVSNQLKKKSKKIVFFWVFLLFERVHTLVFKQMNGRAIFKNLSKFSRGPSLKFNKKKSFSRHHNDFDLTYKL